MISFQRAKRIVEKLQDAGYEAYFAGGWVRDYLLKHPSDDIDIATNARPEDIQKLFKHTVPIGLAFGILLIIIDKESFEIATFRRDLEYIDGRRPSKIEFTNAEEDAKRRDFTINGMFYDPIEDKILDFVGGKEDLSKKIIKAIGNPHERFNEDRLRMVRAIRLACRFHFSIEEKTKQAIKDHTKELFPAVAIERIWQEIVKMASFNNFDRALLMLYDFDLLQMIFPEFDTLSRHSLEKKISRIKHLPKETPVIGKLLELFDHLDISQVENFCHSLKLSKKDTSFALFLTEIKDVFSKKMTRNWENYDWACFCAEKHADLSIHIIAANMSPNKKKQFLHNYSSIKKKVKPSIERIKNKHYIISSARLKKEGIKEGRTLGFLLKEGERLSANEQIHDLEKILSLLKKSSLWPKDNK